MTVSTLKALIVADNTISASTIRRCLRVASMRNVVGFVDAGRPCGGFVAELRPDVVVVDETRSRDQALARIAEIRSTWPAAKVVVLATEMDPLWLGQVSAAGAAAAVRKIPDAVGLGALVRAVVAGDVFNEFAAPEVPQVEATSSSPSLTSRELEILALVSAGASNSMIARQLWITEQTVKFHLSNVYRKLGVANRTQASRYAYENGLLELTRRRAVQTTARSVSFAA
jgi:DNA-binding NarL/FixJ family response regulator